MFGKVKEKFQQWKTTRRLMKDEGFRQVMQHPKIKDLFKDPEFKRLLKTNDQARISRYPKLTRLMRDPEVAPLLRKLDPSKLRNS